MDDVLGFIKYRGDRVKGGYLDTKSSAQAILGLDRVLRHFVNRGNPELAATEFEIPVRIQPGSWEAIVPHSIGQWIGTGIGLAGTNYLVNAAKKLAENDFNEASVTAIFKSAFNSIVWVIRIGKHLGSLTNKRPQKIVWKNQNTVISIQNSSGEFLDVPVKEFEAFSKCPSTILSDIAGVVEADRELQVVANNAGELNEATISAKDKPIFSNEDPDDDEILFPELVHGDKIKLDGVVTRGNERTNSIGFFYQNHVLDCHPMTGSIVRYKSRMFLPCQIVGTISRASEKGIISEKKPKIFFDDLILFSNPDPDLFE